MRAVDLPSRLVLPWASSAGGSYIRSVPVASQIGITNGAASFTDGFPPLNFLPVSAGGVPPFGQDFNGLLFEMSGWDRWASSGGSVPFDATFAAAVGGYPKGARVISNTYLYWWVCNIDNNSNDPDAVSTGWTKIVVPVYAVDTGTADALAIAVNAPITSWAQLVGVPIYVQKGAVGNATTTPTLDITANGVDLGSKTIVRTNGAPLSKFDLINGGIQTYFYDGTHVQVVDPAGGAVVPFLNRFTQQTPGSYSFTALVTGPHRIQLWGPGGGAGGVAGASFAGGGGGGSFVEDIVYLTAGTVYSYTVGAGGPGGGNTGANGTNGTPTTFIGPAGTVTAGGGFGGQGASGGGFGLGGNAGSGSGFSASGYAVPGQNGYQASPQIAQSGAGGQGANGGAGGPASFGGGNGGAGPGGGGSGTVSSLQLGGAGASGQFIISW